MAGSSGAVGVEDFAQGHVSGGFKGQELLDLSWLAGSGELNYQPSVHMLASLTFKPPALITL